MAKKSPRLHIYIFAVFMFLLRPYLAYEITSADTAVKGSGSTFQSLQTFVKKKETHAEDSDQLADAIQSSTTKEILPLVLLMFLSRRTKWFLSLLSNLKIDLKHSTVFQISPTNHYYQRISRLQI